MDRRPSGSIVARAAYQRGRRGGRPMKFEQEQTFADVDAAVKKLLELANGMEADHASQLSVAILNTQFRDAGGSDPEYAAAVKSAIACGYITMHPSGG